MITGITATFKALKGSQRWYYMAILFADLSSLQKPDDYGSYGCYELI